MDYYETLNIFWIPIPQIHFLNKFAGIRNRDSILYYVMGENWHYTNFVFRTFGEKKRRCTIYYSLRKASGGVSGGRRGPTQGIRGCFSQARFIKTFFFSERRLYQSVKRLTRSVMKLYSVTTMSSKNVTR
jgi:hypothetical protein